MKPITLSSKEVFKTPRWKVQETQYQFEGKVEKTYWSILHNPGAVIIPQNGDRFLLAEQYRINVGVTSLEFPMGGIDEGEEPLTAAKRELLEETGAEAKEWLGLGKISNANGSLRHWLHLFHANDVAIEVEAAPEVGEVDLRHFWASADEITTWIKEGRIHDGKTLAAWAVFLSQNR